MIVKGSSLGRAGVHCGACFLRPGSYRGVRSGQGGIGGVSTLKVGGPALAAEPGAQRNVPAAWSISCTW